MRREITDRTYTFKDNKVFMSTCATETGEREEFDEMLKSKKSNLAQLEHKNSHMLAELKKLECARPEVSDEDIAKMEAIIKYLEFKRNETAVREEIKIVQQNIELLTNDLDQLKELEKEMAKPKD